MGGTGIKGVIGAGNTGTTSTLQFSDLLNIFLFRPDINLGATIKDLQQKSILEILAEPNLMAVNGQKATFLAGGEFPFPIVQPSQGFTSITIQFKPFGVRLDFTGTISNDNVIRLHVAPEVSTLDFSNGLTISGFNIPAISTRRAETEVELKDGQSFGIAGLMDHRAQVQLAKVPGIADIPVLGQLFRSRSINRSNTELLVLVTPHIVDPVHSQTSWPQWIRSLRSRTLKTPSSTKNFRNPKRSRTRKHHRVRNENNDCQRSSEDCSTGELAGERSALRGQYLPGHRYLGSLEAVRGFSPVGPARPASGGVPG